MKKYAHYALRLSLAITFVWIGFFIIRNPEAWAGYMHEWAIKLIPGSLIGLMKVTGIVDMIIGLLFLTPLAWLAGLLAAIHMVVVLVTSGITDITVRDFAILGAALAVFLELMPARLTNTEAL